MIMCGVPQLLIYIYRLGGYSCATIKSTEAPRHSAVSLKTMSVLNQAAQDIASMYGRAT